MQATWEEIRRTYRARGESHRARYSGMQAIERWLALVRMLLFLVAAGCFLLAWLHPPLRFLLNGLGGLVTGLFVALVAYHEYLQRKMWRWSELARINEEAVARMERRWSAVPVPRISAEVDHLAVVRDLDLTGHASLLHLVSTVTTTVGGKTLYQWLLEPAGPDEVVQRQQSVAELAPQLELRQELMLRGRNLADRSTNPEQFLEWALSEPWLGRHGILKWIARLLPAGLLALVVGVLIGVVPVNVAALSAALVVLINASLSILLTGKIHDIFNQVSTREGEVRQYLGLFDLLYRLRPLSGKLAEVQRAAAEGGGVMLRLRELSWIMRLAHLRNPLQFIVYLLLQTLMLWDFHVLALLEAWQRKHGPHCHTWFAALGEFEALAALAAVTHDHPGWCFPQVDATTDALEACGLGHPLISEGQRVLNDVTVGPPGTFLLVTGSNMSGKSTLLRAIGLNALLAQAGGPVCATSLRMPPVQVTTSMRINDSLTDGVSFFMAELKRLKQIVDQAAHYGKRPDRRLLYLLDEILLGTNSRERHLAVAHVVSHLLAQGTIGAISTHDLELARHEQLHQACRPVYFTETLHTEGPQQMTFDYRLREGLAPTTNALQLLKLVGLAAADERGPTVQR